MLVAGRVEHVNRIKGLLFSQGIRDYDPLRRDRRLVAAGRNCVLSLQGKERLSGRICEGIWVAMKFKNAPKPVRASDNGDYGKVNVERVRSIAVPKPNDIDTTNGSAAFATQ